MRHCAYCGGWANGKIACGAHADLPAIDPHYRRETTIATSPNWSPISASSVLAERADQLHAKPHNRAA